MLVGQLGLLRWSWTLKSIAIEKCFRKVLFEDCRYPWRHKYQLKTSPRHHQQAPSAISFWPVFASYKPQCIVWTRKPYSKAKQLFAEETQEEEKNMNCSSPSFSLWLPGRALWAIIYFTILRLLGYFTRWVSLKGFDGKGKRGLKELIPDLSAGLPGCSFLRGRKFLVRCWEKGISGSIFEDEY